MYTRTNMKLGTVLVVCVMKHSRNRFVLCEYIIWVKSHCDFDRSKARITRVFGDLRRPLRAAARWRRGWGRRGGRAGLLLVFSRTSLWTVQVVVICATVWIKNKITFECSNSHIRVLLVRLQWRISKLTLTRESCICHPLASNSVLFLVLGLCTSWSSA